MPKLNFSSIGDVASTINKLNKAYQNMAVVYDRTAKDMVSRAPGKIANAVTWMYGIKKSEIKFRRDFKKVKSVGNITAHGEKLSTLEFLYTGRLLTPLHFGMTPKTRPEEKKKYKVKAKIKKRLKAFPQKPKTSVDGGLFIAPAGNNGTQIAWYRYSKDPFDIKPVKTLSLPQMVDNKLVRRKIREDVDDLFHTRYDNHLKQFIKGNL